MTSPYQQKTIAVWLLVCCAAVFAMVVLGGVTRLTGTGLSMVKWEPVTGVLPPLNHEQWTRVFELYQQSPEFKHKNLGMSLDGFKSIFWWEYAHRLFGRLIGFLFFVPLIFFVVTGRVSRSLVPKLAIMFLLGGLQGLLGWYMVKSGLVHDPHVSQYRLTAHLGLALVIYAYMFWIALDLLFPAEKGSNPNGRGSYGLFAASISLIVFLTALSGGFVAGTRAGYAYSTFPTMAGQWIPHGLFALDPVWRNFFENLTTIQFDHRLLATLLFGLILILWWSTRKAATPSRLRIGIHLLLGVACLQVALGISTLLLVVPIALAVAHQGSAVLLLTASLFVLHEMRGIRAVSGK
jgi:cytochrome c oxidase assembly protein subunit 15